MNTTFLKDKELENPMTISCLEISRELPYSFGKAIECIFLDADTKPAIIGVQHVAEVLSEYMKAAFAYIRDALTYGYTPITNEVKKRLLQLIIPISGALTIETFLLLYAVFETASEPSDREYLTHRLAEAEFLPGSASEAVSTEQSGGLTL